MRGPKGRRRELVCGRIYLSAWEAARSMGLAGSEQRALRRPASLAEEGMATCRLSRDPCLGANPPTPPATLDEGCELEHGAPEG